MGNPRDKHRVVTPAKAFLDSKPLEAGQSEGHEQDAEGEGNQTQQDAEGEGNQTQQEQKPVESETPKPKPEAAKAKEVKAEKNQEPHHKIPGKYRKFQ